MQTSLQKPAKVFLSLLCDSIEKDIIAVASIVWDHTESQATFSITYSHNEDKTLQKKEKRRKIKQELCTQKEHLEKMNMVLNKNTTQDSLSIETPI